MTNFLTRNKVKAIAERAPKRPASFTSTWTLTAVYREKDQSIKKQNEFAMSWINFHENKKSATLTPLIMDRTTYIYPEYIHWIADRPWSYLHGFASGCHGVTGVIELRLVFEGGSHGHAVGVPAPVVKVLLAKAGITASQDFCLQRAGLVM